MYRDLLPLFPPLVHIASHYTLPGVVLCSTARDQTGNGMAGLNEALAALVDCPEQRGGVRPSRVRQSRVQWRGRCARSRSRRT